MHLWIFFWLFFLVGVIIHLLRDKQPRTKRRVLEVVLLYFFFLIVGIGGLFAFYGHTFMADQIAKGIGWPTGSPFQFEVAVANLAFGVLGILSIRFRGNFWLATGLGYAVFLLGAGVGHIRGEILEKNYASLNIGPMIIVGDFLVPLLLITLLFAYRARTPS